MTSSKGIIPSGLLVTGTRAPRPASPRGCAVGALIAVVGGPVASPVVAISVTVICGAFCLDMVRMMVVMQPKRG